MRKTAILRTFWEGNQEKIWLRDDLFGRGLNSNLLANLFIQESFMGQVKKYDLYQAELKCKTKPVL